MIRSITLERVQTNTLCEPLQWSNDGQLAVNSTSRTTILEPRTPNIAALDTVKDMRILDPDSFYKVHEPVSVAGSPLRVLNNVNSKNERVTVNKTINDAMIISSSWSPIFANDNHSCFLGNLYNTLELMIYAKSAISDEYSVRYNVTGHLMRQNGLEAADFAKFDVRKYVDSAIIDRITIHSFCFTGIFLGSQTWMPVFLSIATADCTLALYELSQKGLKHAISVDFDAVVNYQTASAWTRQTDGKYVSYLCVGTVANELLLQKLVYDGEKVIAAERVVIAEKSRFLVNKANWSVQQGLLVLTAVVTGKLYVLKLDGKTVAKPLIQPLTNPYYISDIVHICMSGSVSTMDIILVVETGKVVSFRYDTERHSIESAKNELQSVIDLKLKQYEILNGGAGQIKVYGLKANFYGNCLCLAYSLMNAGQLIYILESASTVNLLMIPVTELYSTDGCSHEMALYTPLTNSSLNWITSYWMTNYKDLGGNFDFDKDLNLQIISKNDTFRDFLFANVTNNPKLWRLQLLNVLQSSSLTKNEQFPGSSEICNLIGRFLMRLAISFESLVVTDCDRFIIDSYKLILGELASSKATIHVNTSLLEDTFMASDEEIILSSNGINWTRCSLTKMPLTSVNVSKCGSCGKRMVLREDFEFGEIGGEILGLKDCVYCGGKRL